MHGGSVVRKIVLKCKRIQCNKHYFSLVLNNIQENSQIKSTRFVIQSTESCWIEFNDIRRFYWEPRSMVLIALASVCVKITVVWTPSVPRATLGNKWIILFRLHFFLFWEKILCCYACTKYDELNFGGSICKILQKQHWLWNTPTSMCIWSGWMEQNHGFAHTFSWRIRSRYSSLTAAVHMMCMWIWYVLKTHTFWF